MEVKPPPKGGMEQKRALNWELGDWGSSPSLSPVHAGQTSLSSSIPSAVKCGCWNRWRLGGSFKSDVPFC